MSAFYIKIFDEVKYNDDGFDYYLGEFKFGGKISTFPLSVDSWSIQDYVSQWIDGLERIKNHNESCLVADVDETSSVRFWVLFKENKNIFIQLRLMATKAYDELLRRTPFTLESCYKFIKPRFFHPDSHNALEYTISIDDVDPVLNQLKAYRLKLQEKK